MNIYLDNDTDISKIDIKTKIIFVLVVLVVLINHIRFDNTVLKNVDMEPFSEPVQQEIKNGKTFEHEVSGGVAEITPIADYKIYGRVYDIHSRPSKMWAAAVYPYDVSIGFGDFKFKEVYKSVKVRIILIAVLPGKIICQNILNMKAELITLLQIITFALLTKMSGKV